jgi:hypothetical protein
LLIRKALLLILLWSWVFSGMAGQTHVPLFFPSGGFFDDAVEVLIEAEPDSKIFYTLDGNKPTQKSLRYKMPLRIDKTTVIRAAALYPSGKWSMLSAQTYFIREPGSTIPVISIAAPPALLFDPDLGLFMAGNNVTPGTIPQKGANFWSKKELVIHAEIFKPEGQSVFNSPTGMRLFGGYSRLLPQKSLALIARARYGEKRVNYPIFGKGMPKSYKYLVLRNGGSDFGRSHFRDALMTGLLKDWDIDKQAYRPAHVYINGNYWGIYNLREKVNRHFIADHHDVDKDSIDLLEHRGYLRRGSNAHYVHLQAFLQSRDLSIPEHYEWVKTQMDVDNFMQYQIAQIFFDNQDAGGNIKFWRSQKPEGRWRWILYDTDWGFGLHDEQAWRYNSLEFHTAVNGSAWPNPPWSTFILRKLLENEDFRAQFLTRFSDHLNTTFHPEKVLAAIAEKYAVLLPEMPRHLNRWRLSQKKWEQQVEVLKHFACARPDAVFGHLSEFFDPGALCKVNLSASDGGKVVLNQQIEILGGKELFSGRYFEASRLQIKAVALPGYRFSHWEGASGDSTLREFTIRPLPEGLCLRAVFEPFRHPLADKIVINEISSNHNDAGDWIEIYNTTRETVQVKGWIIADLKHEAVLPELQIGPRDYLLLCRDAARFRAVFPSAYNVSPALTFGLHKRRDHIYLYSEDGALVDEVSYNLPPTDSNFVLSLLLPTLQNQDSRHWEQEWNAGTPSAANPYFVESRIGNIQKEWMEIGIAAGIFMVCTLLLLLRSKGILN